MNAPIIIIAILAYLGIVFLIAKVCGFNDRPIDQEDVVEDPKK